MSGIMPQMVMCKKCKKFYDKNAPGNLMKKCPHCMKKDVKILKR